jgi:peptide/nickel transport system ATP-binding protein
MPTLEEVAPGHLVRCFEWGRTPPVERSAEPLTAPSGRRETLLSVERLRAVYHGPQPVVAAEDVSFSVGAHEYVGLVGKSGSGKTTIARCVAGLHAPAFGQIAFRGRPLSPWARDRSREERRRCQIIFQDPYGSLNPRRRIADEIARAGVVLRGLRRAEARAETARLLDLVRLPSRLADRFPSELSGGERQRVAIARAAIPLPDLIVCDEITSALDVSVQAAVIELLAELRATFGLALLLITHDLGVVASIADRVLVLEQGRICEDGPVGKVLRTPSHPRAQELVRAAPRLVAPDRGASRA